MIDYKSIDKYNMVGTMKFCIKNLPEHFENGSNTLNAIALGCNDIQIIYMLNDNPYVKKPYLYTYTIYEPCLTHRLLRENFFDPNVYIDETILNKAFKFYVDFDSKFPKKRNHYLKMFIRKILKPRININIDTLDKYYSIIPKELQEYFFRTLFYSDSTETSLVIISKYFRDYNTLTYFFRHCKPKLVWDKLIHSISEETFYRIISITNRMKCYQNISLSYQEMKLKHKQQIPDKVYSKIIQDYLKAYTDNSMMAQIIRPRPFTMDFERDYRVQRLDHSTIIPRV